MLIGKIEFQSTHPRRVRPHYGFNAVHDDWLQSTHPRRVRLRKDKPSTKTRVFQSTHPRRVRLKHGFLPGCVGTFQSTHPRRVRQLTGYEAILAKTRFNPRTHVGCDINSFNLSAVLILFQSTHPRRVRRHNSTNAFSFLVFQSTHPRRVRLTPIGAMRWSLSFNPRTHVGCDFLSSLHLLSP